MITQEQADRLLIFKAASQSLHSSMKSLLHSMEDMEKQVGQFMESIDHLADDNFLSSEIHALFGLMRLNMESAKGHIEIAQQLMESAVIDMSNTSVLIEDFIDDNKVSRHVR